MIKLSIMRAKLKTEEHLVERNEIESLLSDTIVNKNDASRVLSSLSKMQLGNTALFIVNPELSIHAEIV